MSEISSASIIELAVDLASSLTNKDRFHRLLDNVRKTIACDAVVLLSFHGEILKPIAMQGLSRDTLGRRFNVSEHPRFKVICQSTVPVRFHANSTLPDPYDGLLVDREDDLPIHSCMGLPLYFDGKLLGLLTIDSLKPHLFEDIPERTLQLISSIAAATLNTAILIDQLESQAAHTQKVVEELTEEALKRDGGELIGDSSVMLQLKREIDIAAPSNFSVLIEGETGVGKELVARTLHRKSNRRTGPMVYVNCAALPENLIESELFGHVKGAFTGADKARDGKFMLAHGGTIFLDEIGELPLAAQSKMLRVIQNGEIQAVGRDVIEHVDVRVIAATNRNLKQESEQGNFRRDLYHRLSVYPIVVPNLKSREGDVSLLCGYFLEQTRRKLGINQLKLTSAALSLLGNYTWPGNVRELEHVISRAALKAKSNQNMLPVVTIDSGDCGINIESKHESSSYATQSEADSKGKTLKQATEDLQRRLVIDSLTKEQGNWAAAARQLGVDRANLARLAKRLNIKVIKSIE